MLRIVCGFKGSAVEVFPGPTILAAAGGARHRTVRRGTEGSRQAVKQASQFQGMIPFHYGICASGRGRKVSPVAIDFSDNLCIIGNVPYNNT